MILDRHYLRTQHFYPEPRSLILLREREGNNKRGLRSESLISVKNILLKDEIEEICSSPNKRVNKSFQRCKDLKLGYLSAALL